MHYTVKKLNGSNCKCQKLDFQLKRLPEALWSWDFGYELFRIFKKLESTSHFKLNKNYSNSLLNKI